MSIRLRRRSFIAALGGAAAWPLAARAQQPDRFRRLGVLIGSAVEDVPGFDTLFLQELAQLGWVEGRTLRVDQRLAGGNDRDAIRPHAEALIRAAPDVIFATPATAVQVLQELTHTIPVVFTQSGDPVQAGTVQSLARRRQPNLARSAGASPAWVRP
jgi:putative ABC transport system substrate-binding protein